MKKIAKILLICLATVLMFAACSSPSSGSDKDGGQDKFSFVGTWKSDNFKYSNSAVEFFYIINAFENEYDCFIFEASTYTLYRGWKGTYSQSGTGENMTITGEDKVYYYCYNSTIYWKEVEIPENATFEVLSNTQIRNNDWEGKDVIFTKQTATSSGSAELDGPFLSVDGYARVETADNGLKITVNNRYNWGHLGVYVRNVNSNLPRESQIYQVLDFRSSPGGNDTDNETKEILFPFVETGNTYEVVVFMQESDWSGWFESKPVLVKAIGGTGELYAKMTSGSYNPSTKEFSFVIEDCENLSNIFNDGVYDSSIKVDVYSYTNKNNVWEKYEVPRKLESVTNRNFSFNDPSIRLTYKNVFLNVYYEVSNKNDDSKYNIKLDPNQKYTTFSMK